jgi:hypothetical protein
MFLGGGAATAGTLRVNSGLQQPNAGYILQPPVRRKPSYLALLQYLYLYYKNCSFSLKT